MENLVIKRQTSELPILENKNMWIGLVFTLVFGPFGLLYCSIAWGIVAIIITALITYFTLGFGLFFLWPILLGLTYFLISRNNNKVQSLNQINYMD